MAGNGKGGWRAGAGRPRLSADRAVHLNVTVSAELAALTYVLGNGNYSAGVRAALVAAGAVVPERATADWREVIPDADPLALHRQYLDERADDQTLAAWLEQASALLWADEHNPAADWPALANALLWAAAHEVVRRQLK